MIISIGSADALALLKEQEANALRQLKRKNETQNNDKLKKLEWKLNLAQAQNEEIMRQHTEQLSNHLNALKTLDATQNELCLVRCELTASKSQHASIAQKLNEQIAALNRQLESTQRDLKERTTKFEKDNQSHIAQVLYSLLIHVYISILTLFPAEPC